MNWSLGNISVHKSCSDGQCGDSHCWWDLSGNAESAGDFTEMVGWVGGWAGEGQSRRCEGMKRMWWASEQKKSSWWKDEHSQSAIMGHVRLLTVIQTLPVVQIPTIWLSSLVSHIRCKGFFLARQPQHRREDWKNKVMNSCGSVEDSKIPKTTSD